MFVGVNLCPVVDIKILSLAKRCGADWTGVLTRGDAVADILQEESGGLDCVFECAGEQAALDQEVELLKPGGLLVLAGSPEGD